ncbi:MAG: VWA domain-containing protein [Pirellulales bacterium]
MSVDPVPRRLTLPSWLVSAVLHALLLVVLALVLQTESRTGAATERSAEVGIVLRHRQGEKEFFEGPDQDAQRRPNAQRNTADARNAATGMNDAIGERPPTDPTDALPKGQPRLGPGNLEGGGIGSASAALEPAAGRTSRSAGGEARTSVFGVEGEGYKFVYVFDRSASMGGSGFTPMDAAKAQLAASLQSLDRTHQFQIIFYNDTLRRFQPTGHPDRLLFATKRNKTLAERFIGGVTSDGATRHEQALLAAVRLAPDVIFFLTDADEPKLYPTQLDKIARRAAGVAIHCIEFGVGPQQDPNNFLVQLARENGGRHAYVDTTQLRR